MININPNNIEDRMEQIHSEISNKLYKSSRKKEAEQLQFYFRKLKQIIDVYDKLVAGVSVENNPLGAWDCSEVLNFLDKLSANISVNQSIVNIFRKPHNRKQKTKVYGDVAEKHLAALIKTVLQESVNARFFNVTNGQNFVTKSFAAGTQQATSHAEGLLKTSIEQLQTDKIFEEYDKKILEFSKGFAEKQKKNVETLYELGVLKDGKIDVNGKNVQLSFNGIPNQITAFQADLIILSTLLNSSTFSVKNYRSTRYNKITKERDINLSDAGIKISFGNTQLYKAITGALGELAYLDRFEKNKIYFLGGWMIYNGEDSGNIAKHFGHLKFLYELRGSGLMNEHGQLLPPVDFIVHNDPDSININVWSTAEIIYNYINTDNTNDLFKSVSMTVSDLKSYH